MAVLKFGVKVSEFWTMTFAEYWSLYYAVFGDPTKEPKSDRPSGDELKDMMKWNWHGNS